jgi:hypothetical protein
LAWFRFCFVFCDAVLVLQLLVLAADQIVSTILIDDTSILQVLLRSIINIINRALDCLPWYPQKNAKATTHKEKRVHLTLSTTKVPS